MQVSIKKGNKIHLLTDYKMIKFGYQLLKKDRQVTSIQKGSCNFIDSCFVFNAAPDCTNNGSIISKLI